MPAEARGWVEAGCAEGAAWRGLSNRPRNGDCIGGPGARGPARALHAGLLCLLAAAGGGRCLRATLTQTPAGRAIPHIVSGKPNLHSRWQRFSPRLASPHSSPQLAHHTPPPPNSLKKRAEPQRQRSRRDTLCWCPGVAFLSPERCTSSSPSCLCPVAAVAYSFPAAKSCYCPSASLGQLPA